jgi:flagellar hook assembly protein FlgD
VVLGFRGAGLSLTDPETFANCPGSAPAVYCQPTVSAVEADEVTLPRGIYMTASPNPLRSRTDVLFGLPSDQRHVRVQVFDARGRLVDTLAEGPRSRGVHRISWSPKGSLPAGSYFFRVAADGGTTTSGKLVVVR